jgi:hypothetical protein
MPEANLDTTNLLLGIMAVVSVLEALLLVAVGVMAWKLYRQAMQTVHEIEQRQVAPLRARVEALMGTVDGILVDVKRVTESVGAQTERVNSAISTTIDRVDETADRVKGSVRERINQAIGMARGIRAIVMSVLGHDARHEPPAAAAGRV